MGFCDDNPLNGPSDLGISREGISAVTHGLLLDLLATGDRDGVDGALELFEDGYRGRWWEPQAGSGSNDRAS